MHVSSTTRREPCSINLIVVNFFPLSHSHMCIRDRIFVCGTIFVNMTYVSILRLLFFPYIITNVPQTVYLLDFRLCIHDFSFSYFIKQFFEK